MKARWILVALAVALAYPAVAAAKAITQVIVANDDSQPVPAKVVGAVQTTGAALERYTAQSSFPADDGEKEVCGFGEAGIQVPAGKRFVIESTIVEVADGETEPRIFLYGIGAKHYIPMAKASDAADTPGTNVSGSRTYWAGSSDARFVAGPVRSFSVGEIGDAELRPYVCVVTRGSNRYVTAQFHGYLEDAS